MNIFDAIKTRKSVRKYLDKPVEEEKLNQILEAAHLAPSASNRQEWRFVVVQDKDTRKKLAQAAGSQSFVGEAPVVLAACAETDGKVMKCGLPCHPINVAIALDHIMLTAVELGLGTCWIGHFDALEVKKILGIPEEIVIVGLMPLGYPADPSAIQKKRLSMDQIIHMERW
jgi:nitroreductase